MPKLTTMQSLLLAHAAQRENESFFPLPDAVTHPLTIRRSIAALIKHGWAKSRATVDDSAVAQVERREAYSVFITPNECAAIGIPRTRSNLNHPRPRRHA